MRIVTTMKLDKKQLPYWSCMLMEGQDCVVETVSDTFNPRNKKDTRDRFENAMIKMNNVIADSTDREDIIQMFLLEPPIATNNRAKGS